MSDQDLICVGAIAGAYGVRGEVRVKSYCAVPEDIENYRPLSTEDGSRQFTLALLHPVKNGFAARIAEIHNVGVGEVFLRARENTRRVYGI